MYFHLKGFLYTRTNDPLYAHVHNSSDVLCFICSCNAPEPLTYNLLLLVTITTRFNPCLLQCKISSCLRCSNCNRLTPHCTEYHHCHLCCCHIYAVDQCFAAIKQRRSNHCLYQELHFRWHFLYYISQITPVSSLHCNHAFATLLSRRTVDPRYLDYSTVDKLIFSVYMNPNRICVPCCLGLSRCYDFVLLHYFPSTLILSNCIVKSSVHHNHYHDRTTPGRRRTVITSI